MENVDSDGEEFWINSALDLISHNHHWNENGTDHKILSDSPDLMRRFPQPIRVLPQDFANKLSLTVYGSRVISYSGKGIQNFGEDLTIYAMLSASMADGYRQLFQFLWKQSKKPKIL